MSKKHKDSMANAQVARIASVFANHPEARVFKVEYKSPTLWLTCTPVSDGFEEFEDCIDVTLDIIRDVLHLYASRADVALVCDPEVLSVHAIITIPQVYWDE